MSTTTVARETCKYPGCGQPAAPASGAGRPPEYCAGRGHIRVSAWRERRRLAAELAGTTISPAEDGNPLTTAKMTGPSCCGRCAPKPTASLPSAPGCVTGATPSPTRPPPRPRWKRSAPPPNAVPPLPKLARPPPNSAPPPRTNYAPGADAAAEEMSEHLTGA
jgi:hypothetical protein